MKCQNCGKDEQHLVRHRLTEGALVYDCHDCYKGRTATTGGEWVQEETTPKYQPAIQCSCCYVKAPFKLVTRPHPGNILGNQPQMVPDLTGWMVVWFPFNDPYHLASPSVNINPIVEADKLCPSCALHVKGTINHHKEGYNDVD